MSGHRHSYDGLAVTWTGNLGSGTSSYRAYSRDHEIGGSGPAPIAGSSDPAFRGDPSRWNPEQLLVISLAQCHMLWYLNLAAQAGVTVTAYEDRPNGVMVTDAGGGGQFEQVTLHPRVTISADSDPEVARKLHARVTEVCFIARSVNFPVEHEPEIVQE